MRASRLTSMLAAVAVGTAIFAAPAGAHAGTACRTMSDGPHADTKTSITESAALSWIAYDNHAKGYYRDESGTVKWVVLCDVCTYHKNSANQRSTGPRQPRSLFPALHPAAGTHTVIAVPAPGVLAAWITPPWASTICRAIAMPRPLPSATDWVEVPR